MKFTPIFIALFLTFFTVYGQSENKTLTLDDAMQRALEKSPTAMAAKHRFKSSYWAYRTFKAEYLPQLRLNAQVPSLNRSIQRIQQDDGTFVFRSSESMRTELGVSLNQKVGFTGGEFFIQSGLERLDLFMDDQTITSYLSTPIKIGFSQPIFGFNAYKWDKEIEPLKYKEAKQSYIETLEQVKIEVVSYFFDVLMAEIRYEINKVNFANNDTLYQIAKGRYNIGTIAENELLQLELKVLQSKAAVEETNMDLSNKRFKLFSFLRMPEDENITLVYPEAAEIQINDKEKILQIALGNHSKMLAFEKMKLQANMNVNMQKKQRYDVNLFASYGLSKSAEELSDVYNNPQNSQLLTLGVQVPIVDWGLNKGKIKMAESNRELVLSNVEQGKIDLEQEILYQINHFSIQKNQLNIAAKSDTIAQKRYNVTKARYLIGKINVTELNIAQEEKDNAKLGYIRALSSFWRNYFLLRKTTLYDFIEHKNIDVNPELLLD